MDIFDTIIEPDETLKLLILHSTKNALGLEVATAVDAKLNKSVSTRIQSISDYGDLCTQLEYVRDNGIHAVLFLAHGDSARNLVWLSDDATREGTAIGTSIGEMLPLFKSYTRKCLLLFGVCHFGKSEICKALTENDAAIAAVVPGEKISGREIVAHYGELLLSISKNTESVQAHTISKLSDQLPSDFRSKIVVFAEDGSGDCFQE